MIASLSLCCYVCSLSDLVEARLSVHSNSKLGVRLSRLDFRSAVRATNTCKIRSVPYVRKLYGSSPFLSPLCSSVTSPNFAISVANHRTLGATTRQTLVIVYTASYIHSLACIIFVRYTLLSLSTLSLSLILSYAPLSTCLESCLANDWRGMYG